MNEIDKLATLVDRLPEAPVPDVTQPVAPVGCVHCACGKKYIETGKVRIFNTRHLAGVVDTICGECWSDVKDLVPIVCMRCKAVVARMQPFRFESGFALRKGETYHTDRCPNCDPACKEHGTPLKVIEKVMFEKLNKK